MKCEIKVTMNWSTFKLYFTGVVCLSRSVLCNAYFDCQQEVCYISISISIFLANIDLAILHKYCTLSNKSKKNAFKIHFQEPNTNVCEKRNLHELIITCQIMTQVLERKTIENRLIVFHFHTLMKIRFILLRFYSLAFYNKVRSREGGVI